LEEQNKQFKISSYDTDGSTPSILNLTGTTTPFGTLGILIGTNSIVSIDRLVIENDLIITNDQPGTQGQFRAPNANDNRLITIDINGNNLIINNFQGIAEFGLFFENVIFTNGTITKTGAGSILIEGINNQIDADITINEGTIEVGRSGQQAFADGPSTITLTSSSTQFQGFGTIGTGGNVTINNNQGFVSTGVFTRDFAQPGTLTLSGNYIQGAQGNLAIQGFTPTQVNTLIINDGSVDLSGSLNFVSSLNSQFSDGDIITVVDNTQGSGISGKFDTFTAVIPPNLDAEVVYESNRVNIAFSSCTTSISAGSDPQGRQLCNTFLNEQERINFISWSPSTDPQVTGYQIYRDGILVGFTQQSKRPFFKDYNRRCGTPSTYRIQSIGSNGDSIQITVK
jgi:autotransporter-associated beta strand protein